MAESPFIWSKIQGYLVIYIKQQDSVDTYFLTI